MRDAEPDLAGHPDTLRWNARYGAGFAASFIPHPLAVLALSMRLPDGPFIDLASGPSGSALLAAGAGRRVTVVDASDVALGLLATEAGRRGLTELITVVHADLGTWRPRPDSYALVLCTGYWDRGLFAAAAAAVASGGLLGWQAFTAEARRSRPGLPARWCLDPGEPASLLPAGFDVLIQSDLSGATRRLLARRRRAAEPPMEQTVRGDHDRAEDSSRTTGCLRQGVQGVQEPDGR
ncbi:MAG TPA: class I SAM-dependent methyltransferase [Streptosporangiaceae bacterium]|nr:class I SAM-dependent methyltransferase [Streptosporangiaceae bacterium]